jgi:CMP/dCMP kinase
MIITIDGPAGSGKTTIARRLAKKINFSFLETGAMYRAITYAVLKNNIDISNDDELKTLLEGFSFHSNDFEGETSYYANDKDVTKAIRSREITQNVSDVSAHPMVREYLLILQRKEGQKGNIVTEGRDMGSVVFPDAKVKFFLSATSEIRAQRRHKELQEKKIEPLPSLEELLNEILLRDHIDSTREIAPLKRAPDALLIDTSHISINEVVEDLLKNLPPTAVK